MTPQLALTHENFSKFLEKFHQPYLKTLPESEVVELQSDLWSEFAEYQLARACPDCEGNGGKRVPQGDCVGWEYCETCDETGINPEFDKIELMEAV